jgi:hypothetical protein
VRRRHGVPRRGRRWPLPAWGGALAAQRPLRQSRPAFEAPSKRGELGLPRAFGGLAQGCAPATPVASRACARVGCADPRRPAVTSQQLTPGLIAFSGMSQATFGCMQAAAHLGPPRLAQLLTVRKPLALCVEPHPVIGLGDATGVWGDAGAGLGHPLQRAQRQERCTAPARGCPCGGGSTVALCAQTRFAPGLPWAAAPRGRLDFRHEGLRLEPLEAWRHLQFERLWRSQPAGGTEGAEGIRAGPAWAQAIGVR